MESINNNFRLKQRGKKWLDGWRRAKRKSNELMLGKRLWAGMMMMRSKPHSRDLKLSSSGKKKYENINIVCCWEVARMLETMGRRENTKHVMWSIMMCTGAFLTLRTCCFANERFTSRYLFNPCCFTPFASPCAMILKAFFAQFNRDYYPICSGTLAHQLLFSHSSFEANFFLSFSDKSTTFSSRNIFTNDM